MLQTSIKMPLFCSKCIMNSALQYFYKSKSVWTKSMGMRADSKFPSVSQIIIHSSSTNAGYTQHLLTTPNYIDCTATPSKKFFKIFFNMQLPAKWQRIKIALLYRQMLLRYTCMNHNNLVGKNISQATALMLVTNIFCSWPGAEQSWACVSITQVSVSDSLPTSSISAKLSRKLFHTFHVSQLTTSFLMNQSWSGLVPISWDV